MNFALPCRSILVTSQNDPWMGVDEYPTLLRGWGSSVIDLGDAGHINTAAGYGPWPYGKQLVDALIYEEARALIA